jgi:hypothetical protein
MRELPILNLGPRTLSRVYCATCKEETLHVRGDCKHCTPQPSSLGIDLGVSNPVQSHFKKRVQSIQPAVDANRTILMRIV